MTAGFAAGSTGFPLSRFASTPVRRIATVAVVWTLVALFNGSGVLLRRTILMPEPASTGLFKAVLPHLAEALAWALVTPAVLALYRKFPLTSLPAARTAVTHLLAVVLVPLLVVAASFTLYNFGLLEHVRIGDLLGHEFLLTLGIRGHAVVLTYAGFVGLLWGADVLRRARARALQAERLRGRLADARLSALRMQLHPHFLFNTLNTILPLIFRDRARASATVVRLGELVRSSLKNEGAALVPLEKELDFLRRYLELEEVRFEDRLTVTWSVEDGARRALVPNLILQPLVENAIRHGISTRPEKGRIEIAAERRGGRLVVSVRDDGPGLPPGGPAGGGVGVENTRQRLSQIFGADHVFALEDAPGGGVLARLDLPLREAAA